MFQTNQFPLLPFQCQRNDTQEQTLLNLMISRSVKQDINQSKTPMVQCTEKALFYREAELVEWLVHLTALLDGVGAKDQGLIPCHRWVFN